MHDDLSSSSDERLLRRVTGEYLEMPGLRLTRQQAQRLWGLDDETCLRLLDALVDLKFLIRHADGQYARLTEGDAPLLRMAKADIRSELAEAHGRAATV